jgi:REP element-mobilizing transposase RayT
LPGHWPHRRNQFPTVSSSEAFSLTPAFRPVPRTGDGHQPFQRLTILADVPAFVLSLLGSSIWGTLNREKLLGKEAAPRLSRYLSEYAETKGVYMKLNYVNSDHVHALVDLPTGKSIEELMQLFKGSSSHWINENHLLKGRFAWGRGYGAFSVSESNVDQVAAYISGQEQHHRIRTFTDELREFIERHQLHWNDEISR